MYKRAKLSYIKLVGFCLIGIPTYVGCKEGKYFMDAKKSDLFPPDYPADLYDRIIEDGAGENTFNVYRVSNVGTNNRDAFLCTYQTKMKSSTLNNRDAYIYTITISKLTMTLGIFPPRVLMN